MPDTRPSQAQEHSRPFYTWKASNQLAWTTKPITKKLDPGAVVRGGQGPAVFFGLSQDKSTKLLANKSSLRQTSPSLSRDFKQAWFLLDLIPQQLFSFYCSQRTFL